MASLAMVATEALEAELRRRGFVIVPKGRIGILHVNHQISPLVEQAQIVDPGVKAYLLRDMGEAIGRKLIDDGAAVTGESRDESGALSLVASVQVIKPAAEATEKAAA